jgi:hypothetical protein
LKHELNKTFRKNSRTAIDAAIDVLGDRLGKEGAGKAEDGPDDGAESTGRLAEDAAGASQLDFDDLPELIGPILARAAKASSRQAYVQVGGEMIQDNLDQMDEAAVEWAEEHAAAMIGKKWVDGELVDNPDARYSITDSTRNMIRDKIDQALKQGWSEDRLRGEIKQLAFSDARAQRIASYELKNAHGKANMAGWRASGVVKGKRWLLSSDHKVTDECDLNADDGYVPLDDAFSSGDDTQPAHPDCDCDVVAVVTEGPLNEGDEE